MYDDFCPKYKLYKNIKIILCSPIVKQDKILFNTLTFCLVEEEREKLEREEKMCISLVWL